MVHFFCLSTKRERIHVKKNQNCRALRTEDTIFFETLRLVLRRGTFIIALVFAGGVERPAAPLLVAGTRFSFCTVDTLSLSLDLYIVLTFLFKPSFNLFLDFCAGFFFNVNFASVVCDDGGAGGGGGGGSVEAEEEKLIEDGTGGGVG